MAIIDTIKWNGANDVFAYRFPNCELTTKSQVVVYESQEAIFVKDGIFYEPLAPGRHVLDTSNYPFLTKFINDFTTGGNSPFTAEVWFVNKTMPLNIKWGTATPIYVEDPKYHIMLPIRAHGQYGMRIVDSPKFLAELVGRVPVFTTRTLNDYFKGIIATQTKDCIAEYLIEKGVSILQMGSRLQEISNVLKERIAKTIEEYGVCIVSFTVNSISADENDTAVVQLKNALAKKAEMTILGYNYQQERSFDVMGKAAANEGGGAGATMMQTGMGLGIGMGLGAPMGTVAGKMSGNLQFGTTSCKSCGAVVPENSNFCPTCGASNVDGALSRNIILCPKCGHASSHGARFCLNCGHPLVVKCSSCGNDVPMGSKFCSNCGKGV